VTRRWAVGVVAALTVVVGAAGVAGAWATSYDRRTSELLLPGTTIEGIAVGGMRPADAAALLRGRLEDPLHRQVTLRAGAAEVETTPWDLGLRVDVAAAVRTAQGTTGANPVVRVWQRLFSSGPRHVDARPRWRHDVLDSRLADLAARVRTEPTGPGIDASTGWLRMTPAKAGLEVDAAGARDSLTAGVNLGDTTIRLPTRSVAPTEAPADQAILIRAGENKLYLYRNGAIAQEWPVATGAAGYPTPVGQWKIVDKYINPTWYNPGSAWARGMPARIGPGPNNPLGTHALALDAPAILIHATPDRASIGYSVSHGCVRMLPEHEIELFEQVEVGTPVVVVNAGEPQARPTTPVAPADPDRAAAVNF
jgi:lipoprotein-anchoring transpeptidase ErfK/SrfK